MTQSVTDRGSEAADPIEVQDEHLEGMTHDLFDSMLGLQIQRSAGEAESCGAHCDTSWQSSIHIKGSWDASVQVIASKKLAERIACCMFMMETDDLSDDETGDAMGEVVNIIGGNVKGIAQEDCVLSLPYVGKFVDLPSETKNLLSFKCEGEDFLVAVY